MVDGVNKGFWVAGISAQRQEIKGGVIMSNNFNWVEVRTRDLERAKRFYETLFGWEISGKENKDFAY